MSSILKLTVENFQSHEKTILEPASDGQLTVVVGPSDSGKTAVIRALRWLLYNIPQGDDFIRVGCTLCRVTLELASGHKIIRERTRGGVNRYKILAPGAEKPETYEGFGHTVPLEVRELTGVQPVTIGDLTLNLNMSEQLEGPFLGSSISGGARARILGKLAGTEEVDHAAKLLGTDLYRVRQKKTSLDEALLGLEVQISEYDHLPKMADTIRQLEESCRIARETKDKVTQLAVLRSQLEVVTGKIAEAQKIIERWQFVGLAENETQKTSFATDRARGLLRLKQSLSNANAVIDKALNDLGRLEILHVVELAVNDAARCADRRRQLKEISSCLVAADSAIIHFERRIKQYADVPEAEGLLNTSTQAASRLRTLKQQKDSIHQFFLVLNHYQDIVNKYSQLEAAHECVGMAVTMNENHFKLASLSAILLDYDHRTETKQRQIVALENQVSELEGAYRDALLSERLCPTCGNEVNPERLKEVV